MFDHGGSSEQLAPAWSSSPRLRKALLGQVQPEARATDGGCILRTSEAGIVETEIGPVEYTMLAFPGNRFKGEIVPALAELVDNETIR